MSDPDSKRDDFEERAQQQRARLNNPSMFLLRIRQRFVDSGGTPGAFDWAVGDHARVAAAKSEPVTIGDEDGLRRAIQGVLWNASNFPAKVVPHMLGQDVGPLTKKVTDAVIAHLAAQPVTGAIEYGLRDDASGHVTRWGEVNFMVDAKDYPGYTIVQRTVSEWVENPNEG